MADPWGTEGAETDATATDRLVAAARAATGGDIGALEPVLEVFAARLANPCSHPTRSTDAR